MYPSRDIVMSKTTFPMFPPLDPRHVAELAGRASWSAPGRRPDILVRADFPATTARAEMRVSRGCAKHRQDR
jgi:hypothetical protein